MSRAIGASDGQACEKPSHARERFQSDAERVALWALRGNVLSRCDGARDAKPTRIGQEFAAVSAILHELLAEQSNASKMRHLKLGISGCLFITKDERRLLNGIAAAQAADHELLDNYLYKLALDRGTRGRLAEALSKLAASLAVHGYWMPLPPLCFAKGVDGRVNPPGPF